MGQAKRRGTREQRVEQARKRAEAQRRVIVPRRGKSILPLLMAAAAIGSRG